MSEVLRASPPISDTGPLPGQEWPEGTDEQSAEGFRRLLLETLISGADPMNIPSAVVGLVSPTARDAWRQAEEESHPLPRAVGQLVSGGGLAGAALRKAASLPGALLAGSGLGAGSDVVDHAAGKAEAVSMATLLKAGLGGLGLGSARMSPQALLAAGGAGGAAAAADVAQGGSGPAGGQRIDIGTTQQRIDEIAARLGEIDQTKLAYGKDKKLSPSRTTELNAQLDAERQRLEQERSGLAGLISEERKHQEWEGAPLREKYPVAAIGATVASLPLSAALARSAFNKINAGVADKVSSAQAAANEGNAVNFVREAEAAQSLSRMAPLKAAGAGALAATVPAEIQAIPDLVDFKTMPRDSRAYQEAARQFEDPATYVNGLAVPALTGIAGAGMGLKMSDVLKSSARADAKALGGSLRGMDPKASTEEKAATWAKNQAAVSEAEGALASARGTRDQAFRDADDVAALAQATTRGAPQAGQQTSRPPSRSNQQPAESTDQARQLPALPSPESSSAASQSSREPAMRVRGSDGQVRYHDERGHFTRKPAKSTGGSPSMAKMLKGEE